jgi:argininosuccinate lyase
MSSAIENNWIVTRLPMKMANKKKDDVLHSARLGSFSEEAADYTSSVDIDGRLLPSVISVNCAHTVMLYEKRIIDRETSSKILLVLSKIPKNMQMNPNLEDVHMNVEGYVISKIGKAAGGMINVAKSRNDQVATALRMTTRGELISLSKSIVGLESSILSQASKYRGSPMPGYTHLQRGQVVTLGHELLAHFSSLDRDYGRLVDCYLRTNLCPMGSGALASTTFEIDRKRVAELLGFDSLLENSIDAVSSRDFATETIYLCSQVMTDLSRLAEELILWTSKEFSFAEIPDEFSSTSSMMPQKKNAIVPEIARARTAQVVGDLVAALGMLKSLPLSYNLDLQELTRNLWCALDKTCATVEIFANLVRSMKFSPEVMLEAVEADQFLFATDLADYLVKKFGIPFREAHQRVGELVRYCISQSAERELQFTTIDQESLSRILQVDIKRKEIVSLVDSKKALSRKKAVGSPNPKLVARAAKHGFELVARHKATTRALESGLEQSAEELRSSVGKIMSVGSSSARNPTTKRNQERR